MLTVHYHHRIAAVRSGKLFAVNGRRRRPAHMQR